MAGGHTILGDGSGGLFWLLELGVEGVAVLPADRRKGYRRAYLGLISPKSANESLRGRQICVMKGPYRRQSVGMPFAVLRACHVQIKHAWTHALKEADSKLRG